MAQEKLPEGFIPDTTPQLPEGFIPDNTPSVPESSVPEGFTPEPQSQMTLEPSHNQEKNRGFAHTIFDYGRDKFNQLPIPIRDIWNTANTPVTTLGFGDRGPATEARQMFREEHPIISKPFDFAIDSANNLLTPLNIGTAGSLGLGRAMASPALSAIGRALSMPVAAEGSINMMDPHSTWADRLSGAIELAGAKAAMKGSLHIDANKLPTIPVAEVAPSLAGPESELVLKNYIKDIGQIKDTEPHRVVLNTISKEITDKLFSMGYKPGGIIQEGEFKGKPYVVKGDTVPGLPPAKKDSLAREIWNLPRGMTTTLDMSAPMRQGLPLIGYKAWWTSWNQMVKAFGSEESFQLIQKEIQDNPYFQGKTGGDWKNGEWVVKQIPSEAQAAGLELSDLSTWNKREELLMNNLVEKIPGFGRMARASNRAYTAFLNKLRSDVFTQLMDSQKAINGGTAVTEEQAKAIATFINDATGRGKMTTRVPGLFRNEEGKLKLGAKERGPSNYGPAVDQIASDILFSPKLAASRVRMLNPFTYTDPKLTPLVRKQYLRAAFNTAAAWTTATTLGTLAGGETSLNPTNADFGKIRFGDMRIDPGAGFQQFMVAYARALSGLTTSSTTGNVREMGQGYNAPTQRSTAENTFGNKLHPLVKFAWDIASATSQRPVQVGDAAAQMFVPLFIQDTIQLAKDSMKPGATQKLPPELMALALSYIGMGSQVYGREGGAEDMIIPPKYDYTFKGGMLPGMEFALSHVLPESGKSALRKRRTR